MKSPLTKHFLRLQHQKLLAIGRLNQYSRCITFGVTKIILDKWSICEINIWTKIVNHLKFTPLY